MCEASSLLSLTSNLVEDIEASGWQQLVHIERVVVNQVEAESGQRGLFAALKCLGSHLYRKLYISSDPNKRSKVNLDTESLRQTTLVVHPRGAFEGVKPRGIQAVGG